VPAAGGIAKFAFAVVMLALTASVCARLTFERLTSEVIRDPFRRAQFPRRVRLRTNRLLTSASLDGAAVLGWCFGDAEAVVASRRSGVADVAEVVVGAGGLRGSLDEVGWSDCRYSHGT